MCVFVKTHVCCITFLQFYSIRWVNKFCQIKFVQGFIYVTFLKKKKRILYLAYACSVSADGSIHFFPRVRPRKHSGMMPLFTCVIYDALGLSFWIIIKRSIPPVLLPNAYIFWIIRDNGMKKTNNNICMLCIFRIYWE